jgi:hypothetical protein
LPRISGDKRGSVLHWRPKAHLLFISSAAYRRLSVLIRGKKCCFARFAVSGCPTDVPNAIALPMVASDATIGMCWVSDPRPPE